MYTSIRLRYGEPAAWKDPLHGRPDLRELFRSDYVSSMSKGTTVAFKLWTHVVQRREYFGSDGLP